MAPEGRQLEKSLRPDGFTPFLIRLLGMAQATGPTPPDRPLSRSRPSSLMPYPS